MYTSSYTHTICKPPRKRLLSCCWIGGSKDDHCSKIFRDMKEVGNEDCTTPIELSCKTIETSEVLDIVFDLVIDLGSIGDVKAEIACRVIRFLKKFEFDRELKICALRLNEDLVLGKSVFTVFLKSAQLEDHDLCGRALEKGSWRWTDKNETEIFGQSITDGKVFDLRTMPKSHLEMIPMDSLWALLRASTKLCPDELEVVGGTLDTKAMSQEYVRLMKLRGQLTWLGTVRVQLIS